MKYAIGIDLGGTSVKGGLVNEVGEIITIKSIPTSKDNNEVIETINSIITELRKDIPIEGVGIGSPGAIDSNKGKVLDIGGNVESWAGVEIKKNVENVHRDIKIKVENDANCAGLCEMWIGSGKGYHTAIGITLGTGLGGFIFWEDNLIRGSGFRGSELGHTILYPNGRVCSCGQKGCTERYVSGKGLEQNYYELSGKEKTGEEITKSVNTDENSKKALEKFIDDLATALVSFKNFFDPEVIIIGGGVIDSSDLWWEDAINKYKEKINAYDDMPIVKSKYLNSSGIIGAASLIFDNYE